MAEFLKAIPWWVWGIEANLFIACIEFLNRTRGFNSFAEALWVTWPFILLSQLGLFHAWRFGPSLIMAWAAFSLGNTILRLANVTWAVREVPSFTVLAGVSLMVAGTFLIRAG